MLSCPLYFFWRLEYTYILGGKGAGIVVRYLIVIRVTVCY